MLILKTTARFERDYQRVRKRGLDLQLLKFVLEMLLTEQELPRKYLNHRCKNWYSRRPALTIT